MIWAAATLVRSERAHHLSVGVAQVQLRHWVHHRLLDDVRFTVRHLRTVHSLAANARVCRFFLEERGAVDEVDVDRLTRLYTGWRRPGFADLLERGRAAW